MRLTPLSSVEPQFYDSAVRHGLEQLSAAEHRFLVETRRKLHDLDPWTRGHFAECLVADLIGAELAAHTVSPHGLEWQVRSPAITIAVRALIMPSKATLSTSSGGRMTAI